MRIPNWEQSPGIMQAMGILMIGIIIGSIAMMIVERNNFQLLTEENIELRNERAQLQENVTNLEKLKNRRYVIKKTIVIFENTELDRKIQSELEAKIQNDLEYAVGNPANVDPSIYRALVDGHQYRDINGINYRIRVTMLAVNQSELSVYVRAEKIIVMPN